MRKLKELLRYKGLKVSQKKTSRALNVSWKTVKKYWSRAEEKGVVYSEGLMEEELEKKLIADYGEAPSRRLDHCDWQRVADEVVRSKAGLNIVWEEETAAGRFSLSYAQFCRRFAKHHRRSALSFHKEYEPGKIAEVDFCDGIDILDIKPGAVISTYLFLMTLGASRLTYAEFCLRQDLPTWLDLHIHAFGYFGKGSSLDN
jgi:transposase